MNCQLAHRFFRMPALACGANESAAARAFAASQWPGESFEITEVQPAETHDEDLFRVRARVDGCSVKIDGCKVPGGFVVTEWI